MFIESGKYTDIQSFVENNTGMTKEELLNPVQYPYIKGIKEAAEMIRNHNGPIAIVGDYDSDGINATAILARALKRMGVSDLKTRLPKRFSEGYGLSETIVDEISEWNSLISEMDEGLIITVDNGIAALPSIEKAKDKGLKVIVTDHHIGIMDNNGRFCPPCADIVVDPNAENEDDEDKSEYKDYCGAAIAFRLAKELLPDDSLLDEFVLASIATVTDVMPLTGTNHWLVKRGLELINKGKGPKGLREIINGLNLDGNHIDEVDYGFAIGPVFNAASRLHDEGAKDVLDILIADHVNKNDVDYLIQNNEERKKITRRSMEIAELYIKDRPIVIYNDSFGEGIIGLIAGKMCEKYVCPSIVFTKAEDGSLKGSGRSTDDIHLKRVLDKVNDEGLILKYGGHAGAAGLSIKEEDLEKFKESFIRNCGEIPPLSEDTQYDVEIKMDNIRNVIQSISEFAPYGNGNPKPRFRIKANIPPYGYKRIGKTEDTALIKTLGLDFLWFHGADEYEGLGSPKMIDCVGDIKTDYFNGRPSNKFLIQAMESADPQAVKRNVEFASFSDVID